jgi:hypothetical protein
MARIKKPPEAVQGGYTPLPHALLDSTAYTGASPLAKALLLELVRQHNGRNNGRLHLTHSWLASRGWSSKSLVKKAQDELIERGLIVLARQGGLVIGPSWYALTWLPVSDFTRLDISSRSYAPGLWRLCQLPPTPKRKPPTKKREPLPDHRGSADPTTGAAAPLIAPTTGAIRGTFMKRPVPVVGDNEYCQFPRTETPSPDPWAKFRTPRRFRFPTHARPTAGLCLDVSIHGLEVPPVWKQAA